MAENEAKKEKRARAMVDWLDLYPLIVKYAKSNFISFSAAARVLVAKGLRDSGY
jgi:hypothetical protein